MVVLLLFVVFRNHPIAGVWILIGLICAAQVVMAGWESYKWKKQAWESDAKLKAQLQKQETR